LATGTPSFVEITLRVPFTRGTVVHDVSTLLATGTQGTAGAAAVAVNPAASGVWLRSPPVGGWTFGPSVTNAASFAQPDSQNIGQWVSRQPDRNQYKPNSSPLDVKIVIQNS
jgi:hypothetical protein